MNYPVVFDVETQFAFSEVGHDPKKLKISVVGIFDYKTGEYQAFKEKELAKLFKIFEHASFLIGYNSNKFDLPVLSSYYIGDIFQFHSLDLMDEVQSVLGYRVALDDLARSTLNAKKSGHGLMAIEYFRNNEWEKLINYCLDDVKITKDLYEYGKKNKRFYIQTSKGEREIPVSLNKTFSSKNNVSLSLPI